MNSSTDPTSTSTSNHDNYSELAEAAGIILQFLEWSGLEETSTTLIEECKKKGWPPLVLPTLEDSKKSSSARDSASRLPPHASKIIGSFEAGNGSKFFQEWRRIKSNEGSDHSEELLTLEFYLHVYFATLPLRTGKNQDHEASMTIFRRYLDTCNRSLGKKPDLLPFFALPYVPDPLQNPAFQEIFQSSWIYKLQERLIKWLQGVHPPRPLLLSYLKKPSSGVTRITSAMVATETAVEAKRGQRAMRHRLQRLNEDYYKLLGVSWELTVALEESVQGKSIDLETTLSACAHRHPDIFTAGLCNTQESPISILKESVQPYTSRGPPSGVFAVSALDFSKVKVALRAAPQYEVLLLLQALRHRVTQVTNGGVRHAVVMSYVRGDVLEINKTTSSKPYEVAKLAGSGNIARLEDSRVTDEDQETSKQEKHNYQTCWERISEALTRNRPNILAQATARLLNALASFTIGRNYLTKNESLTMILLESLKMDSADSITSDMILATLQKLSVRGQVQLRLIKGGAVEWLAQIIRRGSSGCLPPYALEYATALLLNLTLRSTGRIRAAPLSTTLLPSLTALLSTASPSIIPYITGAMYSLLSHQYIRGEAIQLGLHHSLYQVLQHCSSDQKRQIEYLIQQIEREDPSTPPISPPDSPRHLENDPEWLEEELDIDDAVTAKSNELMGEDLLNHCYALHPGDVLSNNYNEITSTRSAPIKQRKNPSEDRPFSENRPTYEDKAQNHYWNYPSDPDTKQDKDIVRSSSLNSESKEEKHYRNSAWEDNSDTATEKKRSESILSSYYPRHSPIPDPNDGDVELPPATTVDEFKTKAVELVSTSSAGAVNTATTSTDDNSHGSHHNNTQENTLYDDQIYDKSDTAVITSQSANEENRQKISCTPVYSEVQDISSKQILSNENKSLSNSISFSRRSSYTIPREDAVNSSLLGQVYENLITKTDDLEFQQKIRTEEANHNKITSSRKNSVVSETIERLSENDKMATQVISQVMGRETRDITTASKAPDSATDPLLRSLPSPKVKEYVAAFSSRPRIPRSPPRSADIQDYRDSSPRSVLPPISRTNLTHSRSHYAT